MALTALAASVGHVVQIAQAGITRLATIGNLLLFTIPGVVLGAQMGPALAERVPDRMMKIGLGVLLILAAALLLVEVGLA